MLLVEADGKALLARHGVPVPASTLVRPGESVTPRGSGPWVVKA